MTKASELKVGDIVKLTGREWSYLYDGGRTMRHREFNIAGETDEGPFIYDEEGNELYIDDNCDTYGFELVGEQLTETTEEDEAKEYSGIGLVLVLQNVYTMLEHEQANNEIQLYIEGALDVIGESVE